MTELDVVCRGRRRRLDLQRHDQRRRRHDAPPGRRHRTDLARLDPGARDPHLLVDRSFRFLLEREPATSILALVRPDGDRPLLPGVRGDHRAGRGLGALALATRSTSSSIDSAYRSEVLVPSDYRQAACASTSSRAAEPFRLDELWPFTERLERFGLAGLRLGRRLARRPTARSARTATSARSATTRTATASGRSRRPRPSSTSAGRRSCRRSASPDTQPFDDPAGRFAFSHNGDLREIRRLRGTVPRRRAGSTAGRTRRSARAGSRTRWDGACRGRSARRSSTRHSAARRTSRRSMPTATSTHYAGNTENPVFTFRLGRIGVASTGIYSLDRSLFRFVAPGATERRLVRVGGRRHARPSRRTAVPRHSRNRGGGTAPMGEGVERMTVSGDRRTR